jgi:hypothetical protein
MGGHRGDYAALLADLFGLEVSVGRVTLKNIRQMVAAERLLFGTLDDDYLGFFLVAAIRALLRRKTAGIFLRPQTCFHADGIWFRLKRAIFALLRKSRYASVFTIIRFDLAPEYRLVASSGVADPQLWDRLCTPFEPSADFSRRIRDAAGSRRILAFIGTASAFKGIAELRDLMSQPDWGSASICVVLVGRVPGESAAIVEDMQRLGAVVHPSFVSNAELDSVYAEADMIWACYSPGYDQASGNFGRALQAGKIPVVRNGTLIEKLAKSIGYSSISLCLQNPASDMRDLMRSEPAGLPPLRQMTLWRDEFVNEVEQAL